MLYNAEDHRFNRALCTSTTFSIFVKNFFGCNHISVRVRSNSSNNRIANSNAATSCKVVDDIVTAVNYHLKYSHIWQHSYIGYTMMIRPYSKPSNKLSTACEARCWYIQLLIYDLQMETCILELLCNNIAYSYDEVVCTQRLIWLFICEHPHIPNPVIET